MSISNRILRNFLFLLIIVLLYSYFYLKDIHYLPHGVHSWAQADRYSIALNYYDNGLQLFFPRVHNLQPGKERIVSCELNITGYIAACIAKPFGWREQMPFLVRFVNLIFIFSALWFVFDVVYRYTKQLIPSLLPLFFAFTSPLIIHYSFNFLPDTSGLAFCWIALALFSRFLLEKNIKLLYAALAMMTLAAFFKITFAIYFGFLAMITIFILWREKKDFKTIFRFSLAAFIGFCSIVALFLWIKYLKKYDESGLFLTKTLIFQGDLQAWLQYIKQVFDRYYLVFFNQVDFYLMPIFALAAAIFIFKKRKQDGFILLITSVLLLLGLIVIFYLLSDNFFIHDYYFLTAAYPFVMFLVMWGSIGLANITEKYGVKVVLSLVLPMVWGYQFYIIQTKCADWRWNIERDKIAWMVEHQKNLDDLGLAKDATIYVYEDFTPNLGLVAFDRYGKPFHSDSIMNPLLLLQHHKGEGIYHFVVKKEIYNQMQQKFPSVFSQLIVKEGDTYTLISEKP